MFGNFSQFPFLSDLHKISKILVDDAYVYFQHPKCLNKEFSDNFEYMLFLKIDQWVMKPFVNIEIAEDQIQKELIELSNKMLKASLKDGDRLTKC